MPKDFDWAALRAMWIDHADRVVAHMGAEHPDETFYVLVFMLEDLQGATLAMQSLEAMGIDASERAGDFYDAKWSPFEWGEREVVDVPDGATENVRLYRWLGEHARSADRAHHEAVHAKHEALIVEVAGVVAERARREEGAFAALKAADDFVVFAREHDVRRPYEKALLTIEPVVLERFFAKDVAEAHARAAVAAMPVAERIAYLVARLGQLGGIVSSEEARPQLAAIGAAAVAPVAALLGDASLGWEAAAVLHEMGPIAAPAAEALIAMARVSSRADVWAGKALGAIGRFDALMALSDVPKKAEVAVRGLAVGRPHTYPQLTALLDRGDATLTAAVAQSLQPGGTTYEPRSADFALVTAYATSPYEPIRADAAVALGASTWSADQMATAVALLVSMLSDEASEVRRLAANALHMHGHHASSALDALRHCEKDRVKAVATYATRAVVEIERDVARHR